MEEKVYKTIKTHNLINEKENIVLGLSGGPDSMALLYVLMEIKKKINFKIYAAHVNHGVRGKEADEDEFFVKQTCETLNIPLYIKRVDMNKYAKENRLSSEEAGRKIRYDFFREILDKIGGGKIAVAHNKNDQSETVLFRFIRGAGIDGLVGMKYKNGDIIRPLLDIDRGEIEKYCFVKNIKTRIDKTNFETLYGRNKIRLELIPYIEKNLNNNIIDTLFRNAKILSYDKEFLDEYSKESYEKVLESKTDNNVVLSKKGFKKLHPAIKARVIRISVERLLGDIKDLEKKHIDDVMNLFEKGNTGKEISINKGILAQVSYEKLIIKKNKKENGISNFQYRLKINEITFINELSTKVKCKVLSREEVNISFNDRFIKFFDYDKIKSELYLRNRRKGDRIVPIGMNSSKKLKDFFIDKKIPRDERDKIPLLVDGNNIVWIIGYRVSEKYKITEHTKNVLVVEYIN